MELANTICESEQLLQEKVISGDTIYVEDMEEYVDNMSNYLGELEDCYDNCNYFLQNETNDCADKSNSLVRLTSRIEQYLFKLLDLVELSIVHTEKITGLLQDWLNRLIEEEKEQFYN